MNVTKLPIAGTESLEWLRKEGLEPLELLTSHEGLEVEVKIFEY